ncbi:3-isopropylmalate dehydratase large subunit [Rhodococcus sp. C26F]|uniref:3-isopropylmalate dehydratase large subunit n=1 Tax=Rhodococcus pyridinivorans AK37 TaxID=1114960 RepID=H0JR82_9NOCA|nr:3-isopropylmalate dehydratase large subunit [Rhodococcus pyridinivorans]EHK83865.1 isopropylmalate isomerase large subunit [Rhodococcus pyridinivorans AK37]MCD2140340.1 3-isopropylmalate dehydratase large subunit [Rhodococcus pyridinivorans]
MGKTLAEKVWDAHVVRRGENEPDLLYIDMHLLHEVNTPQAFDGLRASGRTVRRPDLTLGTEDHNTPTVAVDKEIVDPAAREQVSLMRKNCAEFGIELFRLGEEHQGIVHVIGPELGLSHPGSTIVCCDSHTATQGAFGALAFGIGTSQVEHVLATQTLPMTRLKNMAVTVNGSLPEGVTAKDLILAIIARVGTAGGQGHIIEYRGQAIEELSMEGRMTVCNMSVEAGSRAGMIAPDEKTFEYLRGRPAAPTGAAWDDEVSYWRTLFTDDDAIFDKEVVIDASSLTPFVSWGTTPAQAAPLGDPVPHPDQFSDPVERAAVERAQAYMDVTPGRPVRGLPVDVVFIGSCTNSRIEDLREVARVLDGRKVAPGVELMIVPGSMKVRRQAIDEGLDEVFEAAGAGLRFAGCSMCAALNEDRLRPGQRAASTNNRNFEGRQGKGSRTHIVSPAVAAATAVAGHLAAPADLN